MGRITKGGNYFDKYMKYKNKYLKLKSQMWVINIYSQSEGSRINL
jgi:hypothetical protein